MATIQIKTIDSILDTFDIATIDSISVHKQFDAASSDKYFEGSIAIHYNHMGAVPKSGRVLEVYCKCPTTGQFSAYYYNADKVFVVPCI
jgi:hypothetical protein